MYSSIYRVQSSTRRLPIRALFGFMLKLVESYLSPLLRASVWWFVLGIYCGSPHAVILNKVVEASEKAKLSMKVQVDRHRNPALDYKVGQQVWLSTDNLHMLNRASKKLTEKWIGPYEVTQVTPNAVKLKLPKTLRIHLVVNVPRVKPYLGPLPSQPVSRPGPVLVSEECDEEYKVDYIVASRIYRRQLQYLVHWKGYEEHERTWEPASNVKNAPLEVERFYKENPSAPQKLRMAQSDFDSLFKPVPENLTIL